MRRLGLAGDDARRASLFADRVHQQADLAARPEPGDEAIARGRLVERQAELEDARRPAIVAPERELERLLADVLAQQDDLVALEEVGNPARDQLPRAPARRRLADGEARDRRAPGPCSR